MLNDAMMCKCPDELLWHLNQTLVDLDLDLGLCLDLGNGYWPWLTGFYLLALA